eukprot:5652492-Pleurochrysis_carterae.AAC.1
MQACTHALVTYPIRSHLPTTSIFPPQFSASFFPPPLSRLRSRPSSTPFILNSGGLVRADGGPGCVKRARRRETSAQELQEAAAQQQVRARAADVARGE